MARPFRQDTILLMLPIWLKLLKLKIMRELIGLIILVILLYLPNLILA